MSFWNDRPGPGGVGVRTRYALMLGHVAERFAGNAAVAGYDVMNEPNAFDASDLAGLAALYDDALREIRAGEERAGGFRHLVLFEPSALWSAVGQGPPPDFGRDTDVVYAPHIYSGGFDGGPISRSAFEVAREEAALFDGAPVLTGEWGSDPDRAGTSGDDYFLDHQRLQDEFRFGATLWTWRESCGDPHKAADYRAGRLPEVWGEFEVDCTTNTVVGLRADLVDELTRPLLRAAPGRIESIQYDPSSGSFVASGTRAAAGGTLVLFYPAQKHGRPTVVGSAGLRDLVEESGPGGTVYVTARASAVDWFLELRTGSATP
jgi:endoglycosylceramidase